jgi:hypothetical protein
MDGEDDAGRIAAIDLSSPKKNQSRALQEREKFGEIVPLWNSHSRNTRWFSAGYIPIWKVSRRWKYYYQPLPKHFGGDAIPRSHESQLPRQRPAHLPYKKNAMKSVLLAAIALCASWAHAQTLTVTNMYAYQPSTLAFCLINC